MTWQKGTSGNPSGRPPGSRNKLSQRVYDDLLEDWEAHGEAAIKELREQDPSAYVRVVASLMPKNFAVDVQGLEMQQLIIQLPPGKLREQLIDSGCAVEALEVLDEVNA